MTEQQVAQLIEQNKQLLEKVARLEAELQVQKDLVAALLKKLYGSKSEKLSHDQLLMAFLADEENASKKPEAVEEDKTPSAADPNSQKTSRRQRRNKLTDSLQNLPTTERIVIAPEVLKNPDDYRLIGEERSQRLHVDPTTFSVEIIRRQTHVLKNDPDAIPLTPDLEPCLLPGSVLTPSLGAHLLTEKFCYHQPFYRQEWKLRTTHGLELTRNVMCHWHNHLAELLLPLCLRIAQRLRTSSYLKADETPIRYLDPGTGKTSQGYLWTYHHPEHGVLYDWQTSRANTCLDHILISAEEGSSDKLSFNGYLQSDGLRAYRTFIERHPHLHITPVSCLAHIRRKFIEAKRDHPKITTWILLQIGKIYRLEARLRERKSHPNFHKLRRRSRQRYLRKSYLHLKKLFKHLEKRTSILPKSALGKALRYARDQWPHLGACFQDGQIEFDNNLTENAIRPTKLGSKNWMFIGGADTGWRSAVIYTMIEQIRSHGLDPYQYLKWVFEELMLTPTPSPEKIEKLLPTNWVKAQQQQQSPEQTANAA